ncbi:MAG TPA: hypothetical protein VMT19_02200 [Thermoanaerobaculaceae bacterium]|nr:hypothetical protein [Thermoanaerobaculaceae bacterium]
MTGPEDDELAYYRAVEDHFAALRGTPFLFTPKDFSLLRTWWTEGVPLAAVLAGIGEAWERRRERSDDPISSLSYCRHAVRRHARRLVRAHAGAPAQAPTVDARRALGEMAAQVAEAADRWKAVPAVAAVLRDLERAVASLPPDGEPGALDETLADLEFGTLAALRCALPPGLRSELESEIDRDLVGLAAEGDVLERTRRALAIKAARRLVGLPRLELGAGAD